MTATEKDRGAILLWVAVMIPVLLGMGAFVIDIGALYDERRQLQNGADAAAFAIAESCARGDCGDFQTLADWYANANARDGASAVELICGRGPGLSEAGCEGAPGVADLPAGTLYVHVKTATRTSNGGDEVPFILAPVLQVAQAGQTVRASTTVAWGSLGSSRAVPIALPECLLPPEWFGEDGAINFPAEVVEIRLSAARDCENSVGPNSFDFLVSNNCQTARIDVNDEGATIPYSGGTLDPSCRNFLTTNPGPFILPVFEDRVPSGSGYLYRILGFVAAEICGATIPATTFDRCPSSTPCKKDDESETKVCGRFTTYTTSDGEFGPPTNDYGVRLIKAVG
jgi:Flp pilus assembly protein TadG